MSISRRDLIKGLGVGLAAAGVAAEQLACAAQPEKAKAEGSERLLVTHPDHPAPAPKGVDRLPLEWYKAAVTRLKAKVAERGVDVIVLGTDANMVYFTGCFRGSGERSTWTVFPVQETDTVYWYSPAIDRDLITSWWCTENEYYFCFPHAEGGFPNRGQVVRGPRVNLFEWLLTGLKARGFEQKRIGIDGELSQARRETAARVLPKATFVDISDLCLGMRVIKTPEEIALIKRAYVYFDQIHAFARDYILQRGTEATDFEIGQALQAYGINLMMQDVRRDGKPHTAVGMESSSQYVRTGVATAYPHPNQFFHAKVKKGDALYVNTDIRLGGFGGECYRNYQIAPWTEPQEKMWQVVADSVQIMKETAVPGRVCAEVAEKVHLYQVKQGMAPYIYHRPGHGQGQHTEGHQAPFLALGDETVIEAGMTFSVEPGLYDAERGFGINPSDLLLVTAKGGLLMSSVPYSREWSFLTL